MRLAAKRTELIASNMKSKEDEELRYKSLSDSGLEPYEIGIVIGKETSNKGLKALCARAADALEEEFGGPFEPAYRMKGPVHDLIIELRKAAE